KKSSLFFRNHGLNRNMGKYLTNIGLLISSILVAFTGILKLPEILLDLGLYYSFSGILTIIHDWSGLIMGLFILTHLLLNWRWLFGYIKRMIRINNGKRDLIIIGSLSILISSVIPISYSITNYKYTGETGVFLIDNTGVYNFRVDEIKSVRPEIFKPGSFSLFDILAHLDKNDKLEAEYHFNTSMNTYVIDSINGKENWWYSAYYDGGSHENNAFRLDHYIFKPNMRIFLFQEDPARIKKIYKSFEEEISRLNENKGSIIIPIFNFKPSALATIKYYNISVTAHNLRDDVFQEGVITAIDVIMSMGDQGIINYTLKWYDTIGTAVVRNYWVETINGIAGKHSNCGFVYESGDRDFNFRKGNHVHIPSDIRVINSPEYPKWFYVCV
ncbi:MAG: DUF4405 domain-containing protein, partial [Promethearchaeota archaeon]